MDPVADPSLVLFCKSYKDDVLRARKLAETVARYNRDSLNFYLSVPSQDLELFQSHCRELPVKLLTDEEIIAANARVDSKRFRSLPGGYAQQVVKAEFWRLNLAENYLCLDSDCYFIRPFQRSDLLAPDGAPFTVMHEAKELLQFAELAGMRKIAVNRARECDEIMHLFDRAGRCWDFGPIPVVWSGRVWRDLDEKFLQPRGQTIVDAIQAHPGELRWYGEALLAFRSIPLHPVEPLFRCYHYEEQYYFWKRAGEIEEQLRKNYLGVCRQSNWDKSLDVTRHFSFGRLRRRIKRALRGF